MKRRKHVNSNIIFQGNVLNAISIMLQIAELMQFISNVGTCLHPRKLPSIKKKWKLDVSRFTTQKQTHCFALKWIRICTALQIVPSPKLLEDNKHKLHSCLLGARSTRLSCFKCQNQLLYFKRKLILVRLYYSNQFN